MLVVTASSITALSSRLLGPCFRAGKKGSLEKEPVERSMVIPVSVFKAAVTVALLWKWPF